MFRTELTIPPAARQLSRTARVLTLGSCFADSIGTRLVTHKVDTLANPFGTVFQPLAVAQLLRAAAGETVDWQQHLVEARGRWQSYDLHGSLGAASPVELLQAIQALVQRTGEFVRRADLVVLTLGTAWAYRLRETGELVSNCHKMPAELFVKELLTPDEIINALAETHAYLRRINPDVQIVLTISPVRHLKDTLPLNAVSKSVLRVACHYLSDLLQGMSYFPAYELLTDDLRDYRFYAADMLHPSEVAEDYIWDKFARTYFDVDFGRFRKEWTAVRQSLAHRPLHEGAPEHRQFLENTLERLQKLAGQNVPVEAELREAAQRLAGLPAPAVPAEPEPEDDGEERIDIGDTEGAAQEAPLPASAPADENRTARLSPEEFRSQRNSRDRRGRNERRPERPVPDPAPAAAAEDDSSALPDVAMDEYDTDEHDGQEEFASASEVLGLTSSSSIAAKTTVDATAELPAQEPGKKKKRRSRGGAKRTARKHAARLAAEGGLPAAEAEPGPPPVAEAEADARPKPINYFDEQPAVPVAVEEVPEETPAAPTPPETPAIEPVTGAAAPTREEQRPGKRSSVITKSTPVKRGSRRPAPAARASEAAQPPASEPALVPMPEQPAVAAPTAAPSVPAQPAVPSPEPAEGAAAPVAAKRNRGKNPKARPAATPAPLPETPAAAETTAPATEPAPAAAVKAAGKARPKPTKRLALYNTPDASAEAPDGAPVPVVADAPAEVAVPVVTDAPVELTAPAAAAAAPVAKPPRARPAAKPAKAVAAEPAPEATPTPPAAKPRRPAKASAATPAAESPKPAPKAKPKPKAAEPKPKAPRNATKKA